MARIWAGFLLTVVMSSFVFGQDPADREAEKIRSERRAKLIERVLTDVAEMKLPENRAFVYAKIGAVVWKDDHERGRKLFQTAISELIAAQQFAETNKNQNYNLHDLLQSQNLRPQILNTIAGADAEFALECLYKSRPAAVERALASGGSGTADKKIGAYNGNNTYLAQNEIRLEQQITRMIADQRPERSIAILKDSISKRLSGETFNMLQKLFEKDPETANALANDVVGRLVSRSFMTSEQPNHELIGLSTTILSDFARERTSDEKRITFDESRLRSLAEKVVNTYITQGPRIGYIPIEQLEPIAKRLSLPIEVLKKAATANRLRGHGGIQIVDDGEYQKLMQNDPTPEVLVAAAKNYPIEMRGRIYQDAANRLSQSGRYQDAVALLNDQFEGESLEGALNSIKWNYTHHLIQKGEYDAAESVISEFTDSNRSSAMISLAHAVLNANPQENRPRAMAILNRVRGFLPDRPENSNEMSQLFQLISAMGVVEPSEAFRSLEPLVDQINQITEAWAVVQAFQGGNVRQREYQIIYGANFGIQIDGSLMRSLALHDFDRATSLIDSFSRREFRTLLRVGLIESGL